MNRCSDFGSERFALGVNLGDICVDRAEAVFICQRSMSRVRRPHTIRYHCSETLNQGIAVDAAALAALV